jgi:hypothetical protein
VVSLALGSLSGCAKRPPESASELRFPSAGAYPDRPTERAIDMITNSGDYPDRRYGMDLWDMALTERCMREAGIQWSGVVDQPNPDAKYGRSVSLDFVRQHGYGLSDGAGASSEPTPTPSDDERLRHALLGSPDDVERLVVPGIAAYGYPRHGCAAQARSAVYGDLKTWALIFHLPSELNLDVHQKAVADRRYADAVKRWSACMKERGHSYETPRDIPTSLVQQYRRTSQPQSLEQRKAAEIALALEDARCDKEARLTATRLELRREYASKIDPQLGREINRLAALFDAAEQRRPMSAR